MVSHFYVCRRSFVDRNLDSTLETTKVVAEMKALKSELCTMFSIIYFGMIKFMTEPLYRLDEFVFALENSVVLNKK